MIEHTEDLHAAGFDIDLASNQTILLRALPSNINSESADTLLYELLQLFATPQNMDEYRRREMASILARSAAGQPKSHYDKQEATQIIEQLFAHGEIPRTPNGKSVAIEISSEEVKKRLN